ncbi:hypothetical protein ACROYT_G043102 [Oculina patagonica]
MAESLKRARGNLVLEKTQLLLVMSSWVTWRKFQANTRTIIVNFSRWRQTEVLQENTRRGHRAFSSLF